MGLEPRLALEGQLAEGQHQAAAGLELVEGHLDVTVLEIGFFVRQSQFSFSFLRVWGPGGSGLGPGGVELTGSGMAIFGDR